MKYSSDRHHRPVATIAALLALSFPGRAPAEEVGPLLLNLEATTLPQIQAAAPEVPWQPASLPLTLKGTPPAAVWARITKLFPLSQYVESLALTGIQAAESDPPGNLEAKVLAAIDSFVSERQVGIIDYASTTCGNCIRDFGKTVDLGRTRPELRVGILVFEHMDLPMESWRDEQSIDAFPRFDVVAQGLRLNPEKIPFLPYAVAFVDSLIAEGRLVNIDAKLFVAETEVNRLIESGILRREENGELSLVGSAPSSAQIKPAELTALGAHAPGEFELFAKSETRSIVIYRPGWLIKSTDRKHDQLKAWFGDDKKKTISNMNELASFLSAASRLPFTFAGGLSNEFVTDAVPVNDKFQRARYANPAEMIDALIGDPTQGTGNRFLVAPTRTDRGTISGFTIFCRPPSIFD